jgi:hypothetical protein
VPLPQIQEEAMVAPDPVTPEDAAADPPEPSERGRYAVYPHPSAPGMLIYRATGTCQTCQACGCGDQQEVIDLSPAGVMAMARKMGGIKAMRGAIRIGRDDV